MAALLAVIRRNKGQESALLNLGGEDDPYSLISKFPPEQDRILDVVVEKLMLDGAWHRRRIIASRAVIVFSKEEDVEEEHVIDAIPLFEIDFICAAQNGENSGLVDFNQGQKKSENDRKADPQREKFRNSFQIRTLVDGYNSGRAYYIKASSEQECADLISKLSTSARAAKKAKEAKTRFEKSQERVRIAYRSSLCQSFTATMIIANFVVNAVATQYNDVLNPSNVGQGALPSVAELAHTLDAIDTFFTVLFTSELLVNLYAHWFHPFFSDGWSVFDFVVIALSLVALGPVDMPISVIRLMRTFRVVRLFGRMKALRQIILALSASVIPVANAFFILIIVVAIYAILGVNFYSTVAPQSFLKFDRAFVCMFRIAAGETWVDELPVVKEDGDLNITFASFLFSFVLIVNWTLLQVSVAVLLDSFVSASLRMLEEERQKQLADSKTRKTISSTLDPLLERLSRDFVDNADLSSRLQNLFKVLDDDESQSISFQEICVQIKKLVRSIL